MQEQPIVRRLYRSHTDVMFAGVAGGISEYFSLDPTLVRLLLFLILLPAGPLAILIYIALAFIIGLMTIGRLAVPLLNRILRISSNEVFIIVVFGSLFLLAGLGETIHVAESIGALLMGLILGETRHSERMERLVVPFRDFFGAIFFFSFGLSIDPFSLGGAVWLAVGAAALSFVSVIAAGTIVGRRAKLSAVGSLNLSFTLLARGEFSIIIAALAQAGGLLGILQPFAALYVLILAGASPLLAKESERIYDIVMRVARWRPKRKRKTEEEVEEAPEQLQQ